MSLKDDLIAASAIVASEKSDNSRPGDYCELADESEPDGHVVFRRADGTIFMMMPRADYEAIKRELSAGGG